MSVACVAGDKEHARRAARGLAGLVEGCVLGPGYRPRPIPATSAVRRLAVGGAGPVSAALVRSVARSVNASRELIEDACQTAWRRVPVTQRCRPHTS